jgi:hypothetical protein
MKHSLSAVRLLTQIFPSDIITFRTSLSNIRTQFQSVLLCNAELMCSTNMSTKGLWKTTNGIRQFPQMSGLNMKSYSSFPTTLSQPQQCHNSKCVLFQERLLKVLKCYNFLGVQQHNCSLASIPISQKCQIVSCDTLVANEDYDV